MCVCVCVLGCVCACVCVCCQMESRFKGEMEEHKQKLDKEYENQCAKVSRDLERLRAEHVQRLEKHVSAVMAAIGSG